MTAKELSVFTGLELAMTLHKCDDIKDYWSTKLFIGDSSFSKYQSRNRHLEIRRNIQLHPNFDDATQNTNDPLWHSKHILNHVNKAFLTYAHCVGAMSLNAEL